MQPSKNSLQLVVLCCVVRFISFILVLFILIIQILIALIFVFVLLGLFLCLFPLLFVLFIFHGLFGVLGNAPQLLSRLLSLSRIVGDEQVVENGTRLDLPQVEADLAEFVVLAEIFRVISIVLRIVNLRMHPGALVCRIVDLARLPLALVFRVVNHRWLPLTVHLVVPVLWLGGIRVDYVLWFIPVFWLLIFRIINLCPIIPVLWLLGLRVRPTH